MIVRTLFFISLVFGCDKPTEEDKTTTAATTTTEETEKTSPVGTLSISADSKPGQVMEVATSAVSSAMDGTTGSTVAGKLEVATSLQDSNNSNDSGGSSSSTQATEDPLCSTNATPWPQTGEDANESGTLPPSHEKYAGRFFYCSTNYNTYSPDSILGAFVINSVITCVADKAFPDGYPTELTTKTLNVDFTTPGDCVSQAVADKLGADMNGPVQVSLKAKKYGDDSPWTYYLELAGETRSDIYILASQERVATMLIEYDEDDNTKILGAWQFSLDNNAGGVVARYEKVGVKSGDGQLDGSHLRMLIEGALDAEKFTFSSVDRLEGIYSMGYSQTGHYNASIISVKGDTDTGFRSINYKCPDSSETCDGSVLTNISQQHNICLPATSSCTDNDGIAITTADDQKFIQIFDIASSTELTFKSEMLDWIKSPKPLAFESVTTQMVPDSDANIAGSAGMFTCNQNHEKTYNKNCSTLFSAASVDAASALCRKSEAEGGHGCCSSAKIFTKKYGNIASFEVVPAGSKKGEGTLYTCP